MVALAMVCGVMPIEIENSSIDDFLNNPIST
jgi:hypothetical protein